MRFVQLYNVCVSDKDIEAIRETMRSEALDPAVTVEQRLAAAFAAQCHPRQVVLDFRGEPVLYKSRWEYGNVIENAVDNGLRIAPTTEVSLLAEEYERLTSKLTDEEASGDPHDCAEALAYSLDDVLADNAMFGRCIATIGNTRVEYEVKDAKVEVYC